MKDIEKRKLVKWTDIVIIAILLLICVGFIWIMKGKSGDTAVAEIYYGSEMVKKVNLKLAQNEILNIEQSDKVSFQIENHQIKFVNTDCPDKLCEKCGYLSKPNQVAICMPNKVLLKIVGNNKDVDIIVN